MQNGVQRIDHTFYVGTQEATFYSSGSAVAQSEKTLLGNFLFIRKTLSGGSVVETQEYLYRDHLGSVDAVTNSSGALVAETFHGEVINDSEVNARVQGLGDWLVHGNVRLRTANGVTTIKRERYDFDIKSGKGNTARNIETILGRTYARDGVDFWINFSGSPQINEE